MDLSEASIRDDIEILSTSRVAKSMKFTEEENEEYFNVSFWNEVGEWY